MDNLPTSWRVAMEDMVRKGEQQGRLTHSQINEMLPLDVDVSSWHVETLFKALAKRGIQVVEDDARA